MIFTSRPTMTPFQMIFKAIVGISCLCGFFVLVRDQWYKYHYERTSTDQAFVYMPEGRRLPIMVFCLSNPFNVTINWTTTMDKESYDAASNDVKLAPIGTYFK